MTNTKYLLFIFCLICSLGKISAQSHFEYGVNFGYNISGVTSTNDLSTKSGYNISGIGEYYIVPALSLRLKVSYDKKGFGDADKILPLQYTDGSTSAKLNLNYVDFPLTVNYHFGKQKMFFVNAGGFGAILSNTSASNGAYTGTPFKKTDLGISYGFGTKLPMGENTFFLLELDGQNSLQNAGAQYGVNQNFRYSFNCGIVVRL